MLSLYALSLPRVPLFRRFSAGLDTKPGIPFSTRTRVQDPLALPSPHMLIFMSGTALSFGSAIENARANADACAAWRDAAAAAALVLTLGR